MWLGVGSKVSGAWYGVVKLCGDGLAMCGDGSWGFLWWCVELCVVMYRVHVVL